MDFVLTGQWSSVLCPRGVTLISVSSDVAVNTSLVLHNGSRAWEYKLWVVRGWTEPWIPGSQHSLQLCTAMRNDRLIRGFSVAVTVSITQQVFAADARVVGASSVTVQCPVLNFQSTMVYSSSLKLR